MTGVVRTTVPGGAETVAADIAADGAVVVAANTPTGFVLARYTASGHLDEHFGRQGLVTVPLKRPAGATGIALNDDGAVTVVGTAAGQVTVLRFDRDGAPDPWFGDHGAVQATGLPADATPVGLALAADGSTVVLAATRHVVLARYTTAGVLDRDFGIGGTATSTHADHEQPTAIAMRADGGIVVTGTARPHGATADAFEALAFTSHGGIDDHFGAKGVLLHHGGPHATTGRTMVLDHAESIVSAGEADGAFAAARYTPDGHVDTAYGANGVARAAQAAPAVVASVGVLDDGSAVLAGTLDGHPLVVRFTDNGLPDPAFGAGGLSRFTFGTGTSGVAAVVLTSAGEAVVAGTIDAHIAVARLTTHGTLDPHFGTP